MWSDWEHFNTSFVCMHTNTHPSIFVYIFMNVFVQMWVFINAWLNIHTKARAKMLADFICDSHCKRKRWKRLWIIKHAEENKENSSFNMESILQPILVYLSWTHSKEVCHSIYTVKLVLYKRILLSTETCYFSNIQLHKMKIIGIM